MAFAGPEERNKYPAQCFDPDIVSATSGADSPFRNSIARGKTCFLVGAVYEKGHLDFRLFSSGGGFSAGMDPSTVDRRNCRGFGAGRDCAAKTRTRVAT